MYEVIFWVCGWEDEIEQKIPPKLLWAIVAQILVKYQIETILYYQYNAGRAP